MYTMYMCVRGIHVVSFYDFSVGLWNCSGNVVFFLFFLLFSYISQNLIIAYYLTTHDDMSLLLTDNRGQSYKLKYNKLKLVNLRVDC
jgi:hypothetical protein